MSIPRDEQETTVSFMRDDTLVSIYTSNRTHLDRLRKLTAGVETAAFVKELRGAETWGDFTVAAERFKLFSAIRKPRVTSPEQRAAAAERLSAARARKEIA